MANWLDKALGRKSTTTSVAIVPFDVRCECGARLTGMRAERAKRAICAQCGEAHFLLPVNQYPESERTYFTSPNEAPQGSASARPDPPVSSAPPASAAPVADVYAVDADDLLPPDGGVDLGIDFELDESDDAPPHLPVEMTEEDDSDDLLEFLDEPLESEQRRPPPRRDSLYELPEAEAPDRPAEPAKHRPPKAAAKRQRSTDAPTGMIELKPEVSEWSDTRRRVVFVSVGIVVLAVGMAWWAIRNQAVDHAESRLTAATDDGLSALDNGNFAEAHRQFQIALDALDVIGADNRSVRKLWLETDAATRLLDGSVIDIVEATRDATGLKPDDWQKQFDTKFGDRWVLLDISPVETIRCTVNVDDGKGTVETRLQYPWTVDDKSIHVAGIEKLISDDRTRLLLAGLLVGSRFDSETQAWVVRLDPRDSFLWTRFNTLVQLGFATEDDDTLRRLVSDQQPTESDATNDSTAIDVDTEGQETEA